MRITPGHYLKRLLKTTSLFTFGFCLMFSDLAKGQGVTEVVYADNFTEKVYSIEERQLLYYAPSDVDEKNRNALNTIISVDFKQVPMEKALQQIADHVDLRLSYSIDAPSRGWNRHVSLQLDEATVLGALFAVLHGTDLRLKITQKGLLLVHKGESFIDDENVVFVKWKEILQETISGRVTDAQTGEALPGVNVAIEGTTRGTASDEDGEYNLEIDDSDVVLVFSFIGYATQRVVVGDQQVIDISLEQDFGSLDEVIVVGYGTVQRSDLTGSVNRINREAFQHQRFTQIDEMLAGTVAGLNVTQGTSASGGATLEMRGRNSLTAGTEPLIVLDGVVYHGSLSDINPNDIESIDVLKDASAAAVFGAKAASGVIMLSTTQGRFGPPTINFSSRMSRISSTTDHYKGRDGDGYIQFRQDWFRTQPAQTQPYEYWSHPDNLPDGVSIDEWRNLASSPNPDNVTEWLNRMNFFALEQEGYKSGREIAWFDKVMPTGLQWEGDLSISGGSENTRYYWSIGYLDNEGVIAGDQFSALRTRLNLNFEVADWLDVGVNVHYSDRDESSVTASLSNAQQVSPFGRMYREDGSIEWWPGEQRTATNPLQNTLGQDRSRKLANLFGSLYAETALPFGITHRISFQPRIQNIRELNYWSPETLTGGNTYNGGRATRMDFDLFEWTVDNLIKWDREFGMHRFDVTLLHSAEENRTWRNDLSNNTFAPSPVLGYSGLNFGTNPDFSVYDSKVTGDAMMGRLNYILLDRYLFTGSIRIDGYSAFGQENPRATFPAIAFAWQIAEEDFFNIDMFNQLKLRLSWGVNGNRDIGAYSALAQMGSNRLSDGSNIHMGVYTNSLSNTGLMWEETESYNVGLDISLLQDRFDLSLDYYDMTTSNLLVNRRLPLSTGFTNITTNIGELKNKGFELTLRSVNVIRPEFSWSSNLNFSLNRNEITQLFGDMGTYMIAGQEYEGELPDFTNRWFPGQAIDVVWDYERIGIWQEDEAEEAAVYNLNPGDIKAVDLNADGVYTALQDKQFIGHEQPRFRIGLRNHFNFLQNFTASVFVRADLGHIRTFNDVLQGSSTWERHSTAPMKYWTHENQSNEWPALGSNQGAYGGGINFYRDASFVRIQDLTLSYTVPQSILQVMQLQNVTISASARNVATFTNWPGWDPESLYNPMPRTLTFGIDVSL